MPKLYPIEAPGSLPLLAQLSDDGLLRISGTGENIPWSVPDRVPWKAERHQIRTVEFADEVDLPDLTNWFWGCEQLTEIRNWPSGVRKMQATCCDCHRLTQIPASFPNTLADLDECFIRCETLTTVPAIPSGVIYAADAFADCLRLSGSVTLLGRLTQYACMFQHAGNAGDGIVVHYTSDMEDVIDAIIATGHDGNVRKGHVIRTCFS